jgi:hypothetical protein
MQQELHLQVSPEVAQNNEKLIRQISKRIIAPITDIKHIEILKRSYDARQKQIKVNLLIKIFINENFIKKDLNLPDYKDVRNAHEVIVIGAGPAGLFAALKLIENGLKPIILERGKDVKERRRDLAKLTQ